MPAGGLQAALALHQSERLAEAEAAYRRILEQTPDEVQALRFLGVLLCQTNRYAEAVTVLNRAVALDAGDAGTMSNLGVALTALKRYEEAVARLEEAARLTPTASDVWYNLARARRGTGRLVEALAAYERALALQPDDPIIRNNRGNVLQDLGRFEEALADYQQALSFRPDYVEARYNSGKALMVLDRLEEAAAQVEMALRTRPQDSDMLLRLGYIRCAQRRYEEGRACFEQVLALEPASVGARLNLGDVLLDHGRAVEAQALFREALDLAPDSIDANDQWVCVFNYLPDDDPEEILRQHLCWSERVERPLLPTQPVHANVKDPVRRLRIGYVSPDFWNHPVATFFAPVLEAHDRARVEVFCYAQAIKRDGITERLQAAADGWCEIIGLGDENVAERIREDRVDILVDLTGHFADNRLPAFAYKPAPVQVSWLGYPATTGMRSIDYRLSDRHADPEDGLTTEELVRLPHGFHAYQPPSDAPPVAEPPCLSGGHVTLGSFNNFAKVSSRCLDLWAAVLLAVPSARFLCKSRCMAETSNRDYIHAEFAARGIDPQRVELLAWAPDVVGHLALYGRVDVALDTFPYTGTTTTCEALWMGCPVVSLAGRTHAARVGVSLLHNAGFPEWIAQTPDTYVEQAAALAVDPERLRTLRARMRERLRDAPLLDVPRFARDLEEAYRRMWRRWCER